MSEEFGKSERHGGAFNQPPKTKAAVLAKPNTAANPYGLPRIPGAGDLTVVAPLALLVLVMLILGGQPSAAQIIITEFMASNTRTLVDDFESYEDWIEIHNPGTTVVNLLDWAVTDSSDAPFKWRFPSTNLPPGGYLMVFASNRDLRTPGAVLHTNFKLDAGGEYLALVRPDGSVATEFSPSYPGQLENVSFGFNVQNDVSQPVTTDSPGRVWVPTNAALGMTWVSNAFVGEGWRPATNGIGFETGAEEVFGYSAHVLTDKPVVYWRLNEYTGTVISNSGSIGRSGDGTCSAGVSLAAAGPGGAAFPGLEIRNRAAHFNGTSGKMEVKYTPDLNPGSALTVELWVKPASLALNYRCPLSSVAFSSARFTGYALYQVPGNKWQFRLGSGEGAEEAGSAAGGVVKPDVWQYVVGVYDSNYVRLYLDGGLVASNLLTDVFLPNTTEALRLGTTGNANSPYWFAGDIDEAAVYNRALTASEIANRYYVAMHGTSPITYNYGGLLKTDLRSAMYGRNSSALIRFPVELNSVSANSAVTLRMRYDDGFAAFLNGVRVAADNAPVELEWNSTATAQRPTSEALQFKSFDLSTWAHVLRQGTNHLAIQALNITATNADLLLQAELEVSNDKLYRNQGRFFAEPTPGDINTAGVADLGPIITSGSFLPLLPRTNDNLTVSCSVSEAFAPVTYVTLYWQVMFGPEETTPLYDDGLHGDGHSGDGIYGGVIPFEADGTPNFLAGDMVRWYIVAADSLSRTSRWPLFHDPVSTAQYLGTVIQPEEGSSKLPVVHLFVAPDQLSAVDSQEGGRASVYHDGEFYDNVQMQLRGNTSTEYPKKSHRLEFNREHPFRHPGPGGRLRKTSFVADYFDPTYLRQGLSFWLCDQMGAPAPFHYPVRLQMNGAFYQLANHSQVLGEELLERLGYASEGALYKAVGTLEPIEFSPAVFEKKTRKWEDSADYLAFAEGISELLSQGERETNIFDSLDLAEIINYMAAARFVHENDDVWANMSLYHDNDGDGLWRIVPFDMNLSFGAMFMISEYEGGIQSTNDNHKGSPLYGSSQTLPANSETWNRLYDVVFSVPRTREMYLRRVRTLLDAWVKPPGTPVSELPIEQRILTLAGLLQEEAAEDRAKWGWPHQGGQSNFEPGIDLNAGITALIEDFLSPRRAHFYGKHSVTNVALSVGIAKGQNAGIPLAQPMHPVLTILGREQNPPSGNQDEEWVCITNANGYAVDASGWEVGGAIRHTFRPGTVIPAFDALYLTPSVSAFRARTIPPRGGMGLFVQGAYEGHLNAWGETITLTDNSGRLVNSNSATADPSLAQRYLRITEIMYHPPAQPGSFMDPQALEYLEFQNIAKDVTLNLAGVRLTKGVAFDFTGASIATVLPGQRVLVVRDPVAFASRYGTGLPVAGQYTGALDNAGETLRLEDAAGEKILEFTYEDKWYPITDGLGFSLVIKDVHSPWDTWDRKGSWRASGALLGSPSLEDPSPPVTPAVLVNELLIHTDPPQIDSVELFNPTASNVSLGGWFLTDDFYTPKKYRIPNDTVVNARGFQVLTANQFGTGSSGFAFSEFGEEVWLFAGDAATNLTGYYHGWSFGAAPNGVSFGQYLDSKTNAHFVLQSVATLSAANALPLVGPIVISEIMYHPRDLSAGEDNQLDEFLELANIFGTNVPLYCLFTNEIGYGRAALTNTWRLRNAVDFDFPTNTFIPAAGRILVVGFDPTTNSIQTDGFRAKWNVPDAVAILGPWSGKLDNSGETLELKYPGVPEVTVSNVLVPYIQAEEISWTDNLPWPANADGIGNSLQRITLSSFGNDPTNWAAVGVTTGQGNAIGASPVISMNAPANGATFLRSAGLTLSATATDPDGAVARVEFYADATLLGAVTVPPYRLEWSDPPYGSHNIKAVAVDNQGAVAISTAVRILVSSQSPTISWLNPVHGAYTAIGTPFTLQSAPEDPDGMVAGVDYFFDGALVATSWAPPWSLIWYPPATGWHTLAAVARDDSDTLGAAATIKVFVQSAALGSKTIIGSESGWRYFDLGTDPGDWTALNFDDSGWSNGVAELGYGDAPDGRPESTILQYGPDPSHKYPAYYFRRKFSLDSAATAPSGTLRIMHDDGAIAWLNGTEIYRAGMPFGPVDYLTFANWTASTGDEYRFFEDTFSPALLLPGMNVLAVEVHQVNETSSDLSFAAELALGTTLLAPAIATHPQDLTAVAGTPASFTASAVGEPPLAYQWHFNDSPLAGQTSRDLGLLVVKMTDSGSYAVTVTNSIGAVTSLPAQLIVTSNDTDGDGLPDSWEQINGTNPHLPDAHLDPDRDGLSNWQEYLAGTSPTNTSSTFRLEEATLTLEGGAALKFTAMSNRSYSLLSSDSLAVPAWVAWAVIEPAPSNRTIWLTNLPAVKRFYRLVTPQIP
jgi:hypothetical protein